MSDAPPAEPEAPPEPETPQPEEPTPAAEEGHENGSGDLAKVRREAKDLRAKLKLAVAEREGAITKAVEDATVDLRDEIATLQGQIVERDAQLAAVGKLRNPSDVTRFIDVAETPADKLPEAIAALLKERPYLGLVDAAAVPQGAQNNGRETTTQDASKWLRDAIIAKGG